MSQERNLHLSLNPVPKYDQQLPGVGKCELQQRFSGDRGPMLRVKSRTKKLVVRLYKEEKNLKTHAEIILGDLLSSTPEEITWIPYKFEEGGKIEKAFVQMEQISPNPIPMPPPLFLITFKFLSRNISPHLERQYSRQHGSQRLSDSSSCWWT
ncbi:hypothetical protein E2C01_040958 [Portunus trituberculatus]|uniref:Uncharacterized protein n=1 Tax=Portunus trituberculatus TaxID=210409 RepID=A0A5B7FPD9_PORTR|nr:hypothetical protein [Portunus trituberculatus]